MALNPIFAPKGMEKLWSLAFGQVGRPISKAFLRDQIRSRRRQNPDWMRGYTQEQIMDMALRQLAYIKPRLLKKKVGVLGEPMFNPRKAAKNMMLYDYRLILDKLKQINPILAEIKIANVTGFEDLLDLVLQNQSQGMPFKITNYTNKLHESFRKLNDFWGFTLTFWLSIEQLKKAGKSLDEDDFSEYKKAISPIYFKTTMPTYAQLNKQLKFVKQMIYNTNYKDFAEDIQKMISLIKKYESLHRQLPLINVKNIEAILENSRYKATRQLIEATKDTDYENYVDSLFKLADIGHPKALPVLIRALFDSSPNVRLTAIEALAQTENPRAIPALVRAMQDPLTGRSAIEALGKIQDPMAIPALTKVALNHPNFYVRLEAAYALAEIGGAQAASVIQEFLQNNDVPPYTRQKLTSELS